MRTRLGGDAAIPFVNPDACRISSSGGPNHRGLMTYICIYAGAKLSVISINVVPQRLATHSECWSTPFLSETASRHASTADRWQSEVTSTTIESSETRLLWLQGPWSRCGALKVSSSPAE